jgi:multimeric flavodoxin WrbA
MVASDIIIFATPIWSGIQSSLIQRVIERLDELNDELLETGKSEFANKVGGIVITGDEDGAEHIKIDRGQQSLCCKAASSQSSSTSTEAPYRASMISTRVTSLPRSTR